MNERSESAEGILGCGARFDIAACGDRLLAGTCDRVDDPALMGHVALHAFDQVGNQLMPAAKLDVDLTIRS